MDTNKYWLTIKKEENQYHLFNDMFKKVINVDEFATRENVKLKIILGLEGVNLYYKDDFIYLLENSFFLDLINQLPSEVRACIKNMSNSYKIYVYRKYSDFYNLISVYIVKKKK